MPENNAPVTVPFSPQWVTSQSTDIPAVSNLSAKHGTTKEVIVRFKTDAAGLGMDVGVARQSMLNQLGATVMEETHALGFERWRINGMSVDAAIAQYGQHAAIDYIEPNSIVSAANIVPNDPSYEELWGLNNTGRGGSTVDADIDGPEAGDIRTGSPDVVIGVIDTGVDYTHPDLDGNMWTNPGEVPNNGIDDDGNGFVDDFYGYDFVNNDGDPFDDNDHGTHVAGTIAAEGNNGIGITGVTWSAQIMALKFLDEAGFGTTFDAIQAIEYATLMGADLTNNSWGGGGFSQSLRDAIAAAGDAGQVFVAAAGNAGSNTDSSPSYPAAYDLDNIISVAATDDNDQLASFSNVGETSVDLAAPGVDIFSTLPGNSYGTLSGTSMASPHVAGVVSLLLAENPDLTPTEIKTRLIETVDPLSELDGVTVSGGRLNAFNALFAPDAAKILGSQWNDLNANGIREATEPGLANRTVYLDENENDSLDPGERFALTDAEGDYAFSFLNAGTYRVKEVPQLGWEQTVPNETVVVVQLEAGETLEGIDFGNFLANPASLSGRKWHDLNENGIREATEPGLANWTIYLDANRNGTLDDGESFALTDSSGNYSFTGLVPDTYMVAEVLQPGWRQTTPSVVDLTGDLFNEANDTLATALAVDFMPGSLGVFNGEGSIGDNPGVSANSDVDLIELQLATGDRLTLDIDAAQFGSNLDPILRLFDSDGNQISVSDDDPAPEEPSTFDSFIDYTATTAGTYYVGISSYANFDYNPTVAGSSNGASTGSYSLEVTLNSGGDAGVHLVSLALGEQASNIDFGNFELPPGSISGRHWNDLDGDGLLDADEPGLANWTVYLDQNQNGELDADEPFTLTNAIGDYTFSDLPEGNYTIAQVLQETWQQTTPVIASGPVAMDPEGDTFGFEPVQLDIISAAASMSEDEDTLLLDMNFATPIAAPSANLPESVVGFWDLDLDQDLATGIPSKQSELAPADQQGGPLGVDAYIDLASESLQPGLVNIIDTGNSSVIGTASITYGTNSLQIAVPLSLLDDDGTLNYGTLIGTDQEWTDAAPNSAFGTLGEAGPPAYREPGTADDRRGDHASTSSSISTQVLSANAKTPPTPATITPSLTGTYLVELAAGENITDANFGNWQPAVLAGTKWHDVNGNGVQDADEPGLADWTIYIDANQNGALDADEVSTVTDEGGRYRLALQAGTYTVAEVLQPGWFSVTPEDGSYTVSLQPGEGADNLDFGSQELPATIAGQTWHDLDADGEVDADESELAGWVVYLDENQNNQLDDGERSTVTGANGEYSFNDLSSGTYVVAEVLQAGWQQTFPSLRSSFESNDFTGWETVGDTRIETADFGAVPPEGIYQALLTTGTSEAAGSAVEASELESFLELNSGDLSTLSTGTAIAGSAIKQSVTVSAGTELRFDWNFLTNEGELSSFNDFGFVSITSNTLGTLADTNSVLTVSPSAFQRETGFEEFVYTFETSGTFTIGVGVVDVNDGFIDSSLLVDNFRFKGNQQAAGVNIVTLDPGATADNVNFGNLLTVNEAPVIDATNGLTFEVSENSPIGAFVGMVSASDPEGTLLTYTLTDGNEAGIFAINPAGHITVADSAALDFETAASYALEVTVSDGNLTTAAPVTVDLLDVNEAPLIRDQSFYLSEGSTARSLVGAIAANDPEAGQVLTYDLTRANASLFAINDAGQISVNDPLQLTESAYELTVIVTDDGPVSLSSMAQVTIHQPEDLLPDEVVIDVTSTNFNVIGTDEADILLGTDDDNAIHGRWGADQIAAGGGNDVVSGGRGFDRIWGNQGNDTLMGGRGNDEIAGGQGDDRIGGGDGADHLAGKVGNDLLLGGSGGDILTGGEGDDTVYGEADDDMLVGQQGEDTLFGGAGNDRLLAGQQRDRLFGGSGDDHLEGKRGYDELNGGTGNDTLCGGDGEDILMGAEGVKRGRGEQDILTGGELTDIHSDTFVLGDAKGVFYDEGAPPIGGLGDFALVTDFDPELDVVQLSGSASNYRLGTLGVSAIAGVGIFWEGGDTQRGELIGVLQTANADSLDLNNSSQFRFV